MNDGVTQDSVGRQARRRALVAAGMGWALDGMDIMLYTFALGRIAQEFALTPGQSGALASVTLLASALGGVLSGVAADRFGRVRTLSATIFLYSLATAGTATAHSVGALVFWRTLVGLGLGAEWSAGAALVAESFPAAERGRAVGWVQSGWAVGYAGAAMLSALLLPTLGWRPLFLAGALPALLAVWVRLRVAEPTLYQQQVPAVPLALVHRLAALWRDAVLRRRAIVASTMATCLLCAYWGLFTWIPSYLATPVAQGGAGMGSVRSLSFMLPMQAGAFVGYVSFGTLSDRLGRRPVFVAYVGAAALLVPLLATVGAWPWALWLLAPWVGLFGHGYFSVFGALLAELFPTAIRATAQGSCYNVGRAISAAAPAAIGALAGRYGLGAAISTTAALYVAAALLMLRLPETRGEELT